MRSFVIGFVFAFVSIGSARAEPKTLGIDGGLDMPTGDWSDATGLGIGALARFEMTLQPKLALTARAGVIQHLGKDIDSGFGESGSASATEVPLLGGVRYAFTQSPTSEVYGAAELGLVVYRASIDAGGMSQSNSDTNLGMSLGGGYRAGKLDLRGGLLFPDIGHAGNMGLMATVGYQLTAL